MIHARRDYNRIQDPAEKIPKDEPVFLFRAQDKHAAQVLRYYAELLGIEGGDQEIIRLTLDHAVLMDKWEVKKAPDC